MRRLTLTLVGLLLFASLALRASYDFTTLNTDVITASTSTMPPDGTICLWANGNAGHLGSSHWLFSQRGNTGANFFEVIKLSGDQILAGWIVGANDYSIATSSVVIVEGTYYHVCVTWNDTSNVTKIFFNGTANGSAGSMLGTTTLDQTKAIGNRSDGGTNYAQAKIAHVSVWNSVLSDADITALAGGGCPDDYAVGNRKWYWPLTTNNATQPESWNGDNGTVSGATFSATNPTVTCGGGGGSTPPMGSLMLLGAGR
jgi:hypothetical protein